jgi:DNA-binding MarR family transcriptional regulator
LLRHLTGKPCGAARTYKELCRSAYGNNPLKKLPHDKKLLLLNEALAVSGTGFPLSMLVVLHELTHKGPMTPKQLRKEVRLSPRSVSSALRRLTDTDLCKRVPNLSDMRQPLYCANVEKMKELQINFDKERTMMQIYMRPV